MRSVAIVAYDGVQSLDVSGPAEVLAGATQQLAACGHSDAGYDVSIVSLRGDAVRTESAVTLLTDSIDTLPSTLDTLIVPGGFEALRLPADDEFVGQLTTLIGRCSRLVTVCSGSYLAAATGALDGHEVTTHWARAEQLADTYRSVTVDPDPIFIHSVTPDGPGHPDVWTSAGVTAGIDLCLALVEADHSTEVAQTVAQWLVMFLRRPGGQSQFASPTWIRQAAPGPVQHAQSIVVDDPGADHRVAALARRVGLSERHFIRKFTAEVGLSPARFVAQIRVDAARHELETSDDTVEVIARRCGFGTGETMRRTLVRQLGVAPDDYRRRFTHRNRPQPPIRKVSL